MIEETLKKIEQRIEGAGSLRPENKTELRELLSRLKTEIAVLSAADLSRAQAIAGRLDASTHEAIKADKEAQSLKDALDGLASSVDGFEKKHPGLVDLVNRISFTLSNMGI